MSALGYHCRTRGISHGLTCVKSDVAAWLQPSCTINRDILEILLDPFVFSVAVIDGPSEFGGHAPGTMLLAQVADACESDPSACTINGVLVTDCVYLA